MPLLSVIIPVYNAAATIDKCLTSVLNQTLADIEIIIINDCSTDNSAEIISKYKDKRIILLNSSKTMGAGASRNKGLLFARGKYTGFVDNDDWVDPDYFEKMYNEIIKKDSDICVSLKIENHTKGKSKKHIAGSKDLKETIFIERTAPWAKIFKRSFLYENKIKFGLKRGEDVYPAFLSSYLSCNIAYVSNTCYHCNIREGSISHKKTNLEDLEEIRVYEKILDYIKNSISKEYWFNLTEKRSFITLDFLFNYADKETKMKIIEEYKKVFKNYPEFKYKLWHIKNKFGKLKSFIKGSFLS